MKHILPLLSLLPLLFISCESEPYADFYASDYTLEPFEVVQFYNTSDDFNDYEWDFGDGTFSSAMNPTHFYDQPGFYTVTLTVRGNHGKVDLAFRDIEVFNPTQLEITVLEYEEEYPVPNASVILYTTRYDWEHETNPVRDENGDVLEGITDASGVVTFSGLDPIEYWIDVWHVNHNNYLLAEDDEDFIRTLPLERHVTNTFIAYVDYLESASRKTGRDISSSFKSTQKRVYKEKQNKELVK